MKSITLLSNLRVYNSAREAEKKRVNVRKVYLHMVPEIKCKNQRFTTENENGNLSQ